MMQPDHDVVISANLEQNDLRINPSPQPDFQEILAARYARRDWLKSTLATGLGLASATAATTSTPTRAADSSGESTLKFTEVSHGIDQTTHAPPGYLTQVVIKWGDPILPNTPPFDPAKLTVAGQLGQFGYNNDFLAFMPLPAGSGNSTRGLLCANHEYTVPYLMFSGYADKMDAAKRLTADQVAIEQAAHGHSVVEIQRQNGVWRINTASPYNRRLTATTEMLLSGPAAGNVRLQTHADPTGTRVLGTLNNCAGGVTPWGTVLTCEENFDSYFGGKLADCGDEEIIAREKLAQLRIGIKGETDFAWSRFHDRFCLDKEPREPNRFGWVVEYDPYNPASVPIKRTALGRCKHEGCTVVVSHDGHVVAYTGDDSRGEYLYRFVTKEKYNPADPAANQHLLDEGTLSVAKLTADGKLRWLPLVHGSGSLTADNGFDSQADVLINARLAGDAVGATPLDRPEDIEIHSPTGRVFVMLTNNASRTLAGVANPRVKNVHGHILELHPPTAEGGFNHTADEYAWDLFLLAGDPGNPEHGAKYHPDVSANGWLSCPDNCAIDPQGRLWISTDGAPYTAKMADGIYATDITGPGRALTRMFFRAPTGAELTGTCFTPDGNTLFVSVQHPGDEESPQRMARSTFDEPSTRWPDFDPAIPPRPSVVAICKEGNGMIGN
ncbi:MAG: PhoX family phosphatase [Pirellulales bacterium]|nr:PhoX family phosphatase [Pirellulales bacterium]